MEYRKLQRLGTSSYFITLPKEWVELLDLKAGDKIGMTLEQDGTVKIIPKGKEYKPKRVLVVDASKVRELEFLIPYLMTCAYIFGYDTIELKDLVYDPTLNSKINEFLTLYTGMVAVDQSHHSVRVECVIDTSKVDATTVLKRTLSIVVDDVIDVLLDNTKNPGINRTVPQSIIVELRKLHNLVLRALVVGRREGLRTDTTVCFVAAALFEMLVNYMLTAANTSSRLKPLIPQHIVNTLKDYYEKASEIVTTSILSLLSSSMQRAQTTIRKCREFLSEVDDLLLTVVSGVDHENAALIANIIVRIADAVKISLVISNIAVCSSMIKTSEGIAEKIVR